MLDDLIQMRKIKKPEQLIELIRFKWKGELLAYTNPATLTTITDIYKSNKHATTVLRTVVHYTFFNLCIL